MIWKYQKLQIKYYMARKEMQQIIKQNSGQNKKNGLKLYIL